MPRTSDLTAVRRVLNADRGWSVYMLADLEPPYSASAEWHMCGRTVLLLYRALGIPVLVVSGPAEETRELLREVASERKLYLSVKAEVLPLFEALGFAIGARKPMLRMLLPDGSGEPAKSPDAQRLGPGDYEAVLRLHADGDGAGETPDFFDASMLRHGVYYGVRESADLIACAGTHVFAPRESVAGVGNVYTRRDRRGRGLAGVCTAAVVAELRERNILTIALNVAASNAPAIRVYERLGFDRHCAYYEGIARQ